ncbi:SpoIIE family protein phosphatase [Balneolaceae bacterium ANBcel3]|nr:SpoIIE family protein phosphatase [Balneolaceae bacterium ANBcel3]
MIKRNSLSYNIISKGLLFTGILLMVILSIFYFYARQSIEESTRENAIMLGDKIVAELEKEILPIEVIPHKLALMLEKATFDPDSLFSVLERVLDKHPTLLSMQIAYKPYFFPEKGESFAPYVRREDQGYHFRLLGEHGYRYHFADWYQVPAVLEEPHWSEPYYGEVGQAIMTTYSVPFYKTIDGVRTFAGIVAFDMSLDHLTAVVRDIGVLETGYAFILSRNGVLLSHFTEEYVMHESFFSLAEEMDFPGLRETGRSMIRGDAYFGDYVLTRDGKDLTIYYTPLPTNQWTIAVVYPDDEMFASLHQMSSILFLLMIFGLILLAITVYQIVSRQIKPLTLFTQSAREIAQGTFDTHLPCITTNNEMKELYDSFSHMQEELKRYIEDLKKTTAAKEAIESQLRIARDIQLSMVPRSFPAFPDLPQIDLYATLKSAREVGGDLYNFFMIDTNHMGFTIGDVSDKGVPAALFMAMTNTLVKANALSGLSPAEVLEKTNYELCQDNEACMFVTLFFGILDIRTGEVRYANAGHNPFILVVEQKNAFYQKMAAGMVLGAFEESAYVNEEMKLEPNQTMFVYTDGVTEAMDKSQNQFGEEKLLQIICEFGYLPTTELIQKTMDEIKAFVKGHEQSDDITLLALRFKPEIKITSSTPLIQ